MGYHWEIGLPSNDHLPVIVHFTSTLKVVVQLICFFEL